MTDPKKLAGLLRAIDDYQGGPVVKAALKLQVLFFVRPGELRQAEWAEINLETAEWNIPAERMKMEQAHLVPLSRQAVKILKELEPLTGMRGKYVFPGRTATRPMSDMTLNAALRYRGFGQDEVCAHGFRATARTLLDEVLQFRPEIVEHQLAHTVRDALGSAYNRTQHLEERRHMMQTCADYLDGLKTRAQVIPFSKRVNE